MRNKRKNGALTACRRVGYLYADLKPQNVTVSEDGTYHISDLGLFALDSLAYASLPDRYRSAYTPPEIQEPSAPMRPGLMTCWR